MPSQLARRVLARFLIATDPEVDLINSLNRLVKQGGTFKSGRQAAFLWQACKRYSESQQHHAWLRSWAQPYLTGPNSYPFLLVARDDRFGRSDTSKIRYYGFSYVLDGAGIVASARVKVQHPKAGETTANPIGIDQTLFERKGGATEQYDAQEAERQREQRERALAETVAKNQEWIDRLEHLKDTNQRAQESPIIDSFLKQLRDGKQLSPAQLGLLRKFMDVEIDDSSWATTRDESFHLTEERLIKPAVHFFQHAEIPGWDFAKDVARDIDQGWKHFKQKPRPDQEVGLPQEFTSLPELAGWRKPAGVGGFLTLLAKMDALAKKGQAKAPRTLLKLVRPMQGYLDWLKRTSPQEMQAALAKKYH